MQRLCPQCQHPLSAPEQACLRCNRAPRSFSGLLQSALELTESDQFSAALERLNSAIEIAPKNRVPECYAVRGFAHLKQQDYIRAEEDCSEAISYDWEQAQTYAWRAAARAAQNKWKLAFDDLERAYQFGGHQQDRYLMLMDSMAENARTHFREQIQAGNQSVRLFFERGWMYSRLNQFKKALADFRHALSLKPRDPWSSTGLAQILVARPELKGLDRVLELTRDGLAGDSRCKRQACMVRADYHAQLGHTNRAKDELQMLAQLSEGSVIETVKCAERMNRAGDHLSAIALLSKVIQEYPERRLALLKRGEGYAAISNFGLAIEDFSAFLDTFPDSITARVHRASALVASGRVQKAVTDLERACQLDENHLETHLGLAKAWLELGMLDRSLPHAQRAVQIGGASAEAYSVLAMVYSRLGNQTQAIEEYTRSVELAPTLTDQAQYRFLRGIAFYESDHFESALADLDQASIDRPHHAGTWIWKAATSARLENWGNAIRALQQAIQIRPTVAQQYQKMGQPIAEKAIQFYNRCEQRENGAVTPNLYLNRGLAHQFLDQNQEAVRDFSRAIQLAPDDFEPVIRRAEALAKLDNFDGAAAQFSKVLKHQPNNDAVLFSRSLARLAQGDDELAKEDLLKAIELAPSSSRYWMQLGETELKSGNRREALNALDRAIQNDPTHPAIFRLRGTTHFQDGEYLQSIRDFTHSLELLPTQWDLLVQRGEAHLKTNQPLTALEDFETALTHDPVLAKAYAGRASILVSQQRHEYALIWLTKAIHRFAAPEDLSEIMFARGKVFHEMARHARAISDFNWVIDQMRRDSDVVLAARYARAVSKIHLEQFDSAAKDFQRILKQVSTHKHARGALKWLMNRQQPLPAFLYPPVNTHRPTRPAIERAAVVLSDGAVAPWETEPPYDLWLIRTPEEKEYGPVPLSVLVEWASEGRLTNGMKLLRADWSKWKRIERVFPEVTPVESLPGLVESFPALDLNRNSRSDNAENIP